MMTQRRNDADLGRFYLLIPSTHMSTLWFNCKRLELTSVLYGVLWGVLLKPPLWNASTTMHRQVYDFYQAFEGIITISYDVIDRPSVQLRLLCPHKLADAIHLAFHFALRRLCHRNDSPRWNSCVRTVKNARAKKECIQFAEANREMKG